jgi:hypothetical protein
MRRFPLAIGVSATLLVTALMGPAGASAATEFGDNCLGNELTESTPLTFFPITAAGDTLPLTAPSAGVITKWKVNLVPTPVSFNQTLRVLRQNGSTVQVIGEATGRITGGSNVFETRIPVQAGDHLGVFGSSEEISGSMAGNLFCKEESGPENSIGAFPGGGGVGSTSSFTLIAAKARFPVAAVIEPDADGDGYGDETQDKCPQSAALQTACTVVKLSSSLVVKKGLASVLVTASAQASVTVKGTVKLGKGKTAKLSGGTQIVAPGALARFTVPFPKSVKARLEELSPKQSLPLKLSVSAPNLVGAASRKVFKKKLRGQAKPQA